MSENWTILPVRLPFVVRRCHTCASGLFRAGGRFRVNANHKAIDAWLLVLCVKCGETAKLTVLERVTVRSVRPGLLDRLHDNDPGLVAELLQDPSLLHRNRVTLDWEGAWRLVTGGPGHLDGEQIEVRFAAPIPLRPIRVIAEGLGLSRAGAERLVREGKIVSAVRLGRRTAEDFTFRVKTEDDDQDASKAPRSGADPR